MKHSSSDELEEVHEWDDDAREDELEDILSGCCYEIEVF